MKLKMNLPLELQMDSFETPESHDSSPIINDFSMAEILRCVFVTTNFTGRFIIK